MTTGARPSRRVSTGVRLATREGTVAREQSPRPTTSGVPPEILRQVKLIEL